MKKILKFIILIGITIWVISFSYADGNIVSEWKSLISTIVDLLDILWLPFAIIAWKLFTNDLVYGSWFNIDSMLWNVWNFSRTLANYIIWFIFIISILLFLLWRLKNIFSTLWKLVVATILVNASWFILAVIIDISTILLVAVGSLPMHLMWTSSTWPVEKIKYCSVIEIDPTWVWKGISQGEKNITLCKDGSVKKMSAESFFRWMNNMTWPLVFIWSSILNIDKNWNISPSQVNGQVSIKKSSEIRNMLHFMVVALFVVPIFLLVIIWIIRTFWMWIYISFIPLLILDYIFWSKYISSKHKNFKLSNVIWLIFQPVLIVLAMWIAIIFLATVQTALIWWWAESRAKKDLWICSEKSLCIKEKPIVTMEWSLLKDFMKDVWWWFGYIILTILSFVTMWWLIKLAFTSNDITSWVANWTFNFVEEWLKTVPIVPTKLGGVWIWAMQQMINSKILKRGFQEKAAGKADSINKAIDKMFGVEWQSIWQKTYQHYIDEMTKTKWYENLYKIYMQAIEDIKKKHPDIIPNSDWYFKELTYNLIINAQKRDSSANNVIQKILKTSKKSFTEDELFNNAAFRKFLSWIIKDPSLLNSGDMSAIYSNAQRNTVDLLNKHIKDI